ncbi:hypothetical protein FKP32DRAFT_1671082, partial [Trametes sanguinea]
MSSMNVEFYDCSAPRYGSSTATRQRRKSKRKLKGGKPGHPGNFSPGRVALFAEHQDAFNKIAKTARTPQDAFWRQFFKVYWAKFPWTVPLKFDPDEDDWEMQADDELDEAERAKKGKVIKKVMASIKRHMRYVRDRLHDRNPWTDILSDLGSNRAPPPPPPRQLAPWQLYMSKKKAAVDAAVAMRREEQDVPASQVLALRSAVARELLAQEPEEYRTALQTECEELRELEDAQTAVDEGCPPSSEEARGIAREKLAVVVQPLLELLRSHTGFYFTLLAGVPHANGTQLKIISAGKTGGPVEVPWHLHEAERFKRDVMGSFTRFLAHTPEGLARSSTAAPLHAVQDLQTGLPGARASQSLLSPLGLVVEPLGSSSQAGPSRKRGRRQASDDEGSANSSEESTDESSHDYEDDDSSEDEDFELGDDGEEGEGNPEEDEGDADDKDDDSHVPSADDLGLNDAVRRQLALMNPRKQRSELRRLSELSEFDLETVGNRVRAAEIIAGINGGPAVIPLTLAANAA